MKTLKFNLLFFLFFFFKLESHPKVTILTSLFNGKDFIEGFMKDITSQTIFNKKINKIDHYCELIIIDCASQQNEIEIIEPYLKKYPNIIYKRFQKDPGLYSAWNYGLSISSGEYITNANVDDRLANDCLEYLSKFLDTNPDIDFVYSDNYITFVPNETFDEFKEKIKNLSDNIIKKDHIWSASAAEFSPKALLYGGVSGNHPMWKRSIHQKAGMFNHNLKVVGDFEMWLRAYLSGMKIKKMSGVHGLYFRNPLGLSSNNNNARNINKELKKVLSFYKNKILFKKK